ncbi:MAG: RluA family pseudouridine synthase [Phascolarctobacterium sp.]|nr:MAG: RluA family pseudouridine synthase [Phascolarctobacterium sp.]
MFTLGRGNIYYEDESLLIINKPAGMLVHPTVKEDGGTLYNHVKRYYEKNNIESGLHPVSRLDRNTSGLVIFAKQPRVQFLLSQQQVVKKYLGITATLPPALRGCIEAPIARREGSIIERCVSESGKYARTDYQVLATNGGKALVELTLYTGRTHQIRVHLAHIGCPLYNDNLYGTPGPQSRHALHASYLKFTHPAGGRIIEISCALPEDLRKIIY